MFLDYFNSDKNDAVIVSLEGRMFPVHTAFLDSPTPDYVQKAAETVWSINMHVSISFPSYYSLNLTTKSNLREIFSSS